MIAPTRTLFRRAGNGYDLLGPGWFKPDPTRTWSNGTGAQLIIPADWLHDVTLIEIICAVFNHPPLLESQRVRICLGEREIFNRQLGGICVIDCAIEKSWLNGGDAACLIFDLPDAASPASVGCGTDPRPISVGLMEMLLYQSAQDIRFDQAAGGSRFGAPRPPVPFTEAALRGVSGLSLPELATSLESLGLNCEFGLFQRCCGVETLGLLRFAGLSYRDLLGGLSEGFAGIDDAAQLVAEPDANGHEMMILHRGYDLRYHTFMRPEETAADQLIARQQPILQFRRRALLEILATGEKLFVLKGHAPIDAQQAMPVLRRLRQYGPNCLLFVSNETGLAAGSVEQVTPYLYRGSLDGVTMVAGEGENIGADTWLSNDGLAAWSSLCANAYRLWRQAGYPGAGG